MQGDKGVCGPRGQEGIVYTQSVFKKIIELIGISEEIVENECTVTNYYSNNKIIVFQKIDISLDKYFDIDIIKYQEAVSSFNIVYLNYFLTIYRIVNKFLPDIFNDDSPFTVKDINNMISKYNLL